MTGTATMAYPRVTAPRGTPRLLGKGGADLPGHVRAHGPLTYRDGLIEQIGSAGLTGRGGAGFPATVKMTADHPM